jgi:hypothetical protein
MALSAYLRHAWSVHPHSHMAQVLGNNVTNTINSACETGSLVIVSPVRDTDTMYQSSFTYVTWQMANISAYENHDSASLTPLREASIPLSCWHLQNIMLICKETGPFTSCPSRVLSTSSTHFSYETDTRMLHINAVTNSLTKSTTQLISNSLHDSLTG